MNRSFQDAFAPLHAPRDLPQRVLAEAHPRRPARLLRTGLLAAALAAALTATACAADYFLNQREVFFFDTLEALVRQQAADMPENTAIGVAIPCPAEEIPEMETAAQYVARAMERGLLGEETLLSQATSSDPRQDGWEEQVVRQCEDDYYGPMTVTYRTASFYGEQLPLSEPGPWDLHSLAQWMTPEEGAQILVEGRRPEDGQLAWVQAHLGYDLPQGGFLNLSYSFDPNTNYGTQPEYVLNSAYDQSELYTTRDGRQALVLAYDGQVWATAAYGSGMVSLYTDGCTVGQVEEILDGLKLAFLFPQ